MGSSWVLPPLTPCDPGIPVTADTLEDLVREGVFETRFALHKVRLGWLGGA